MKSDFPLLKKILYFVLSILFIVGIFVYNYRFEIVDNVADTLGNNPLAVKRTMADGDVVTNFHYNLRPERNDIGFIRVTNLRTGPPGSTGIPVNFLLTNEGDSNDFPSIRLVMQTRAGRQTREIIIGPREYVHAEKFEKQTVEIMVSPRSEEFNFTVQPFYPPKL